MLYHCLYHAPPHPPPRAGKSGEEAKKNEIEAAALARIMEALEQGKPARSVALNEEEAELGACGRVGGWSGRASQHGRAQRGGSTRHLLCAASGKLNRPCESVGSAALLPP